MTSIISKLGIAFAVLCIFSCNTEKPETSINDETSEFFIPNPQTVVKQDVKTLEIGQKAPEFNLPGIDGRFHALVEYDAEVLVVLFTCNHCPTAQAYEDRVIQFVTDYSGKNVRLVAISPNSPPGVLLEELGYSDLSDSFEEMKIRARDKGYNFPYLYDGDTQEVSLKYGPVATPQVFVFDKKRILQYVGRLDDKEKPGSANAEDLRHAVDRLLEGKLPETAVTKTFGCSTKWGWKIENRKRVNDAWAKEPVEVSKIDYAGIKTLLKNEDSKKLRLLNIWATWCGPCKVEYPQFIDVHRMYKDRDFEFVSLSADQPTKVEKVLEFLKVRESAVKNYLFDSDDKYALIEAIDPEWNGALPYTLLIEPMGNVVWKHQGEVDFHELKKFIVEHEMIGRYY
jgi:thiol-disulfide isomerase/thioredoxin